VKKIKKRSLEESLLCESIEQGVFEVQMTPESYVQKLEAYIEEGHTQPAKDEQMHEVKVDIADIIRNFQFDGIHERK